MKSKLLILACALCVTTNLHAAAQFFNFNASIPNAWNYTNAPTKFETDAYNRGAQFSGISTSLTLNNSKPIKKVILTVSTNASDNSISVTVGGSSYGSVALTDGDRNKVISFQGSSSGNIVISCNNSSKSIWIKDVLIEYSVSAITTSATGGSVSCSPGSAVSQSAVFFSIPTSWNNPYAWVWTDEIPGHWESLDYIANQWYAYVASDCNNIVIANFPADYEPSGCVWDEAVLQQTMNLSFNVNEYFSINNDYTTASFILTNQPSEAFLLFYRGTPITLTVTPNNGYHFTKWSDGNTSNPRQITINNNASYQAICESGLFTISCFGTNGNVIGGGQYALNTQCTLTAIPNQHYHFVSWSDGSTINPRTITVTNNASYTAIFAINQYTLTVTSANYTQGWVVGGGKYDALTNVPVMAAACAFGYKWDKWSDGVTLAGRQITLTSDTTLTAYFVSADEVECIEVEENNALLGTADIQIIATPNKGAQFTQWSDGNTDNPRIVTNTPGLYIAIFSDAVTKTSSITADQQNAIQKRIVNDQLIIQRDGKMYNAQGGEL